MGLPYPDSLIFPNYHIFLTKLDETADIERQRRHYRDIFGDDE